jgi:predicted nucleic acid-binding protein
VSTRYYLDTSALVKLYHQEAGTDQVEALFTQTGNSLIISELGAVELYSTVARKTRTGEITEDAFEEVCKNFDDDCNRRFVVTPLSVTVSQKAKELLRKHGKVKALRALDALHLGAFSIALSGEPLIFVCSDNRLLEIAALEGYAVLNPEDPPKS